MNAGTAFLGYSAGIFLRETAARPVHLALGSLLFLLVFLLSGGAAALNNYQDRHIDARSPRTFRRPIPAKRISSAWALILSIFQIVFSLLALTALSDAPAASAVALAAVVLYNGFYTPLKRRTLLAFLPGLLSGSLPPVIGWLAAGGPLSAPVFCYMTTALFLWQLPHYWLLLLSENPDRGGGLPSFQTLFSLRHMTDIAFTWIVAYSLLILWMPLLLFRESDSSIWQLTLFCIVSGYALSLIGASLSLFKKRADQEIRAVFRLFNALSGVFVITLSAYFLAN